ncbi:MAG: response regulator [Roseburia sp.]|jgi:putative two-component system response regulator|nr:response regulator [Roseburia sp.]
MADDLKKLLVVDSSESDRNTLKNLLANEFQVLEADNGYAALEMIRSAKPGVDGVMMEVSMPVMNGFDVMRLMQENEITGLPVFLMTADATKENVEKAVELNAAEFIRKPFDKAELVRRLKAKMGVVSYRDVSEEDIAETSEYITRLEETYKKYLTNAGKEKDSGHYKRMADLMKILLSKYSAVTSGANLSREQIEIISRAAFFCDIGFMMLPAMKAQRDETDNEMYQSHARLGVDIVRLNNSRHCEYFVQICSDMCMHHHEKFDGSGFPDRISGNSISVYTQMCRLVDAFDNLYFKYREHNELQFDFVTSELSTDKGGVSSEIFSMLTDCKFNIVMYYGAKV